MSTRECTEEMFLRVVKDHKLTILKDDGLYRDLDLSDNGSFEGHYHVVTWPGHICMTGDYGTYVFSRIDDMFGFFRGDLEGPLKINVGYWAEKCLAESIFGEGIREFSVERWRENVIEYVFDEEERKVIGPLNNLDWDLVWELTLADEEDLEDDRSKALYPFAEKLDELKGMLTSDNEIECISAYWSVNSKKVNLSDFWESKHTLPTYHFIWCLYAIVYAIRMYDKAKGETSGKE